MFTLATFLAPFPAVLGTAELVAILGFDADTVDELCREGHIQARRVDDDWVIGRKDLEEQLLRQRNGALQAA